MRNPDSVVWLLYGHEIGCQGNIREGKYFAEKWQHLQIVALKAEHTVLLSADVEGSTINGKRGCRVR